MLNKNFKFIKQDYYSKIASMFKLKCNDFNKVKSKSNSFE